MLKGMLPLLLLATAQPAVGQNSIFKRHTTLESDNVLIRTDNTTFITCCNTGNNRSCFIVDNGTTCREFFTTTQPTPPYVMDSGYVVNDMQLVDGTCWFAGYKWVNTGQTMYTLDGQPYILFTYAAFIGKFNTADVLNGSGNYRIIEITDLHHIERLAVIGNNVTAIGVKTNGQRHLVELKKFVLGSIYTLYIEESSLPQEVFMDVVAAGNKIVLLSRFSSLGSTDEQQKYFGLRYGSAGAMKNNNALHRYDVSTAHNSYLTFPSLHPIRLAATHNGNGVVVGYVAQNSFIPNALTGKFILFHIDSEGTDIADVCISNPESVRDFPYNLPKDILSISNIHLNVNCKISNRDAALNVVNTSFPRLFSSHEFKSSTVSTICENGN